MPCSGPRRLALRSPPAAAPAGVHYLDRLARLVCELSLARVGEATRHAAKFVVLDTLGAILAGSRLPENACLARLAAERAGRSTATLVGQAATADPLLAALTNATAGVSLEVDEGNRLGGGHPAVHVVPAALALAEDLHAPPARFLEAVIAGYEAVSRLGSATSLHTNVHPHGTWGTVGAAVASARLLGYDEHGVRAAVSLAASMSPANSWTPCLEGATIRNLYPGRSSLNGILAAHLHGCGYTAVADGPGDVFGTILGDGFDGEAAIEGWGEPYRIESNYFKLHACCLYNHPPLNLLAALRAEIGFQATDVERIEVSSIPAAAGMTSPEPPTMLAAKFSIPYALAASIVLDRTDVSAFELPAREDPAVLELARRVVLTPDPSLSIRDPGRPLARLTLVLCDGRSFTREATTLRGDAADPVPAGVVRDKFLALATPVLGERAGDLAAVVERLDELPELGPLTALLRA